MQHHQTSFATNAKGTSLGRKEKATTRNKKITNGKAHQEKQTPVKVQDTENAGTSLVVQWLRIRLPTQGTWV